MAEAAAASGAVGDVEGGGSAGAVPVNAKAAKRAADVLDSMDRLVAEQQGRDPDAVKGREGKPVMAYGPDGVARPLELDSDTASEDPDAEPYYWEDDREVDPPLTKQVWHTLHWTGYKVFQGMELAGEVIADFLGLNQSRYQWVLDQVERDREEAARRAEEEEERAELRRLARLAEQMEREEEEAAAAARLEGGEAGGAEVAGGGGGGTAAAVDAEPAADRA